MSLRPPTLPRHFFQSDLQDARPASEAQQKGRDTRAHHSLYHSYVEELKTRSCLIYNSEEEFDELVTPSTTASSRVATQSTAASSTMTPEEDELETPSSGASAMKQELEEDVSLSADASSTMSISPPTHEDEAVVSPSARASAIKEISPAAQAVEEMGSMAASARLNIRQPTQEVEEPSSRASTLIQEEEEVEMPFASPFIMIQYVDS